MSPETAFRTIIGILIVGLAATIGTIIWHKGPLPRIQGSCPSCNVVIIDITPLRADALPCYGYLKNTMPNLCRFANRNTIFTNTYAQASWTLPSIMSLVTGELPSSHGIERPLVDTLAPNIVTIPQAVKQAGYHTIYIGEIGDNNVPLTRGFGRGFDEVRNNNHGVSDLLSALTDINKRTQPSFIFFHTFAPNISWADSVNPPATFKFDPGFTPPFRYDLNRFVDTTWRGAITYLDSVHRSDLTPSEVAIREKLKGATSLAEAKDYFRQLPQDIQEQIVIFDIFDYVDVTNPTHMRYLRDLYDDRLAALDNDLKPFFDAIDAGKLDQTVVIITSDHGDEYGEHGKINHGNNLFATTTHIPLIVSIPGITPQKIDALAQTIDIYPTLLDTLGITTPGTVEGISLYPNIIGNPIPHPHDYVVGQLGPIRPVMTSIRNLQWLYILETTGGTNQESLYDLTRDPNERTDVIGQFPAIAARIKSYMLTHHLQSPMSTTL